MQVVFLYKKGYKILIMQDFFQKPYFVEFLFVRTRCSGLYKTIDHNRADQLLG